MKKIRRAATLAVFFFLVSSAAHAEMFMVTRIDDPTPGPSPDPCLPGDCSLREAVISSNANNANDEIVLGANTYSLTRQGAGENAAFTGDLDFAKMGQTVVISGVNAATTKIDATNLNDRIFEVAISFQDISMTRLTLQNGDAGAGNGGAVNIVAGGSTLFISDSRLEGNHAMNGGAIWACCPSGNEGLTVERSVFFDNVANGDGGAIQTNGGFTATILDSTVDMNSAINAGGGIFATQAVFFNLDNSTISNNTAGANGGGLQLESLDSANLNNSTVSGNEAVTGGGISSQFSDFLRIRNVTITENASSGSGGGFYGQRDIVDSTIANSILSGNTSSSSAPGADCFLNDSSNIEFTSLGFNIFGDISNCTLSGPGDLAGIDDPELGPLTGNGGLTFTHAPSLNSPAIDHGDPSGCKDSSGMTFMEDQRGAPRPLGICDSGAVEIASGSPEISVDRTAITFGNVALEVPNTQNITIGNNDVGVLNVTGMNLSNSTHYSVAGGTCGGTSFTLSNGESCTAEVTFMPQAEGSFNATLTIVSNDPVNPSVVVNLSGVGVQVNPTTPPACGNGILEAGEECEDGNTASGDGCSATCLKEAPPPAGGCQVALAPQIGFGGIWLALLFNVALLGIMRKNLRH